MKTLSNCCGAHIFEESDICADCLEHCQPIECCSTCGAPMNETETNYGTEHILTCIHCYQDARETFKDTSL